MLANEVNREALCNTVQYEAVIYVGYIWNPEDSPIMRNPEDLHVMRNNQLSSMEIMQQQHSPNTSIQPKQFHQGQHAEGFQLRQVDTFRQWKKQGYSGSSPRRWEDISGTDIGKDIALCGEEASTNIRSSSIQIWFHNKHIIGGTVPT